MISMRVRGHLLHEVQKKKYYVLNVSNAQTPERCPVVFIYLSYLKTFVVPFPKFSLGEKRTH